MTGHLNHHLAQQLIDERLRDARKRQAWLRVAEYDEHHDRERTFSIVGHVVARGHVRSRRREPPTQRSR